MKKIILVLGSLVLMSSAAQAQWVAQPIDFFDPEYTAVNSLNVVNSNVAWASTINFDQDYNPILGYEYARTTDGGTTWNTAEILGLASDEYSISIFGLDANTAYVTAISQQSSRLLKTTDGGATWATSLTFSSADSYPDFAYFFNANEGVCVGDPIAVNGPFEVYTTANAGANWTRVTNIPASLTPNGQSIEYPAILKPASFGNSIWIPTNKGRIFYSSDKGKTWNVSTTGYTTSLLSGLAFRDASNGLAVITDTVANKHTLLRTADGGITWSNVAYTGPLHSIDISWVPGNGNYISVGVNTGDTGSSYSRDNGQTWVPLESTLGHLVVSAASPTAAWTGAYGPGVYKLNTTVLSTRQDVALQQGLRVYPNPSADGQFTVQLGASLSSDAQVSVFDALGRNVYTQAVKAVANPTVAVNLARQAAGIYTLRVSSASGVAQQKLVVK